MSEFTYTPAQIMQTADTMNGLQSMIARGDDGGTVWCKIGDNPTMEEIAQENGSGYVVGGVVPALILGSRSMVAHPSGWHKLLEWIENHADEISACEGVGFWVDSDGQVWFDVIEVYRNERQALRAAKVAGELAIWDMVNNVEIQVED